MPHKLWIDEKDYVLIPRISDIVSTYTCEYTAYANPINKLRRGEKPKSKYSSNVYAFRGTLVHHQIENEIRKELHMPPVELELSFGERKIYEKIMRDEQMAQDIFNHVEISVDNYHEFRKEVKVKPIAPERQVLCIRKKEDGTIDVSRSIKGTIDLIGEIETENGWETAIIDWKSSKQFKKTYGLQLTGYYYMLMNCGVWEELVADGRITYPYSVYAYKEGEFVNGNYDVPRALCVALGNEKKGYQMKWYPVDNTDFFRTWEIFNNPKPSLQSHENPNNRGMKLMCMMCSYRDECPMFYQWTEENEQKEGGEKNVV